MNTLKAKGPYWTQKIRTNIRKAEKGNFGKEGRIIGIFQEIYGTEN